MVLGRIQSHNQGYGTAASSRGTSDVRGSVGHSRARRRIRQRPPHSFKGYEHWVIEEQAIVYHHWQALRTVRVKNGERSAVHPRVWTRHDVFGFGNKDIWEGFKRFAFSLGSFWVTPVQQDDRCSISGHMDLEPGGPM